MNRRIFYILIVLVSFFGIFFAFIFIPSRSDLTELYLLSNKYNEALSLYKDVSNVSELPYPEIKSIVNIYLNKGEIHQALAILNEYTKQHPKSLEAFTLLAQVYDSICKPYLYLLTLEKMNQLQPSAENLREMVFLYYSFEDYTGRIRALEMLAQKFSPTQNELYALSYLYNSKGQTKKALKILDQILQQWPPEALSFEVVSYAVEMKIANNQMDGAFSLAKNYVFLHPDVTQAASLSDSFVRLHYYEEALDVLDSLPEEFHQNRSFIQERFTILNSIDFSQSYSYVKSMPFEEIPRKIIPEVFELAIDYRDYQLIKEILEKFKIEEFSDRRLVKLLILIIQENNEAMAEFLETKFKPNFLKEHPVVQIGMLLATNQITEEQEMEKNPLVSTPWSETDKFFLAELYDAKNFSELSKKELDNISSWEEIPADYIGELAELYINSGKAKEALAFLENLRNIPEYSSPEIDAAWAVVAWANGKTESVMEWLIVQQEDESFLKSLFDSAEYTKQYPLALIVALKLHQEYPSEATKRMLIIAYLKNGESEKALALLKQLKERDIDLYIEALAIGAKEHPEYAERAYKLILKQLQIKSTTDVSKNKYGHFLVLLGIKELAENLFFELAQQAKFNDDSVQMLLKLWGKDLDENQIAWMQSRIQEAKGNNRLEWILYLFEIKQGMAALEVITYEDLHDQDLLDNYVDFLVRIRGDDIVEEAFDYLLEESDKFSQLKMYGKIAYLHDFWSAAQYFYEKALSIKPYERETLKALAITLYWKNAYCYSFETFGIYRELYGEDLETAFYSGEILWAWEYKCDARSYLSNAYSFLMFPCISECTENKEASLVSGSNEKTSGSGNEEESNNDSWMIPKIIYRLGYPWIAESVYRELIAEYPKDQSLMDEYADLLLDRHKLWEARDLLFSDPKTFPQDWMDAKERKDLLYIQNARVRYFRDALLFCKAFALSNELLYEYPEEDTVLESRAELENEYGRWRRAISYLDKVKFLHPDNEYEWLLRKKLMYDHWPYVSLGEEYRKTQPSQKELLTRFDASIDVTGGVKFLAFAERDFIRVNNFTNVEGIVENVRAVRYRGFVGFSYDDWCGDNVRGKFFYGQKDIYGVGAEYTHIDPWGFSTLLGEYRYPYWEYPETVIESGTRNRFQYTRFQRVNYRFDFSVSPSVNKYQLQGVNPAAYSFAAEANATYHIFPQGYLGWILGDDNYLNLSYLLDTEYPSDVAERVDPEGVEFQPFPIVRREQHSLILVAGNKASRCFRWDGYFGYSYDRYGIQSFMPIYMFSLLYGQQPGLEIKLEYEHTVSQIGTNLTEDRYLVNVKYSF